MNALRKVYVDVPWALKGLAESMGGKWERYVRETGFDADTDLTELYAAIDAYYRENPRVRAPKAPPIQTGEHATALFIPFKAPGAEQAREFINANGGRYYWEKAEQGEKGYYVVPNEHLERVKGMIELPAINWSRS